ncbi:MAG: hypothetical protein PVI03_01520 [Candidatus Thorarchaeota archaeon]|jgi:hypothetical protein
MSYIEAQDTVDILEDEEVLVDLNEEEEEDTAKEEEPEEEEVKADSESEDKSDLPEKFKGKSIEDIITSYENLEKEYGRRNNEVGELRKLTDQLLSLERSKQEETVEEEDDEFLSPQEQVDKALQNNPEFKKLSETVTQKQRAEDLAKFESAHPDWKDIMGSEKFLQWVGKSRVRAQMLLEANEAYDYGTGADLLSEFKELHPVEKTEDNDEADTSKEALKDITTETKSKSKHSRKKIYKRAQLINLKLTNPDEYARREDEFLQAYAEGRVR